MSEEQETAGFLERYIEATTMEAYRILQSACDVVLVCTSELHRMLGADRALRGCTFSIVCAANRRRTLRMQLRMLHSSATRNREMVVDMIELWLDTDALLSL